MAASDYRILIVDDEPDIVEFLSYNFTHEGYNVFKAYNGEDAIRLALKYQPHLIILDVMLPGMDGIEVCELIRANSLIKNTIVALLTARSEDYSQVAGFNAGADDYITKPLKLKPFISRITALLKRYAVHGPSATPDNIACEKMQTGNIEINSERHSVTVAGKEMLLPKKEYQLLYLLASKPGMVFTREVIFSQVWGDGIVVSGRTIDVHIRKLREKVGSHHIKTLKGVGYIFQD